MARISTYGVDTVITDNDYLLGLDGDNSSATKRFQISALKAFLATQTSTQTTFTGTILPNADGTLNIGSASLEWNDLFIDGTANIDNLLADAATIGGALSVTGVSTFTEINLTGEINLNGSAGIDGYYLASNGNGADPTWNQVNLDELSDAKNGGTNFTGSLLIGHETTGTLDNAQFNTAVGVTALDALTSGDSNTAIGHDAATSVTTGSDNIAVGRDALQALTTSSNLVAIGSKSGQAVTTGASGSTFVGYSSGFGVTTGTNNTLIGHEAGKATTSGNENVALGSGSLLANTTGDQNIAIGYSALAAVNPSSSIDTSNVGIGYRVGFSLNTGIKNILIGCDAGYYSTTASSNVAIGHNALYTNVDGDGSVAIGFEALYTSEPADGSSHNTAIGYRAGKAATTAVGITFVGSRSGEAITTGNNNAGFGVGSLRDTTVGVNNTAIGPYAMQGNVQGDKSVAVGHSALIVQNAASSGDDMHNTAVGYESGYSTTVGIGNTFIGSESGRLGTSSLKNTAVGYGSLYTNVVGDNNTAVGHRSLYTLAPSDGLSENVGIGASAGLLVSTGVKNTLLGSLAGDVITTGDQNIMIGYGCDPSAATTDNEIVIGSGTVGHGANITVIGNTDNTAWHPADDNGVDLGSTAYSFKDTYIQGSLKIGDTSGSTYFQFPTATGTNGQILKVPSSGNVLEWGSATGITHLIEDNSFYVGQDPSSTTDTAEKNQSFGVTALNAITTGDQNTAFGHDALGANTTGSQNIAIGSNTLSTLVASNNFNIAIGNNIGQNQQDQGDGQFNKNTLIGHSIATTSNSSVAFNNCTVVGYLAGSDLRGGDYNTFIGSEAGKNSDGGNFNTFIGSDVAKNGGGTLFHSNVAIGYDALSGSCAASKNVVIGNHALNQYNDNGDQFNVAIGYEAGGSLSTGEGNIFLGGMTSANSNASENAVVLGFGARSHGDNIIVLGNDDHTAIHPSDNAGFSTSIFVSTGTSTDLGSANYSFANAFIKGKIAVGSESSTTSAYNIPSTGGTTGQYLAYSTASNDLVWTSLPASLQGVTTTSNFLLGEDPTGGASYNSSSAINNTSLGKGALGVITTSNDSTAIGFNSLSSQTIGNQNTAVGSSTLKHATSGNSNTAMGYHAGDAITTGDFNTVIGDDAGSGVSTGDQNTAIGYKALMTEDGNGKNTAIGSFALNVQNAGADGFNVAVGTSAGVSVTTGIENTIIGALAGDALTTGTKHTIIGTSADTSAVDTDYEIVIGAAAVGLGAGQTVIGHTTNTTVTNLYGAVKSIYKTGTTEGTGIDASDAVSISVGEYNGEIVTSVFVDIGVGSILSSGSAGDVIGNDGVANAYITKLTTAINGLVYRGEIICLEVPTTGDPDVNVSANSSGTIAEDAAGEGQHVLANCGVHTLALKTDFTIPAGGVVDDFIYLTHGGTTAGTYNAGKFLLRFYGAKVTGL